MSKLHPLPKKAQEVKREVYKNQLLSIAEQLKSFAGAFDQVIFCTKDGETKTWSKMKKEAEEKIRRLENGK